MRKIFFALVTSTLMAGVAFVGCGGGDDTVTTKGDMTMPKTGDMAMTGGDGAMPKTGCAGFVTCYTDCFANSTTATATGCQTLCGKTSKSGAANKFNDALACGQEHCLGDVDAMSGKCHLSGNNLVNADGTMIAQGDPGTGQKACGACLNDSLARLFGGPCANMSSTDCNPTECKTITDTCLNDTP